MYYAEKFEDGKWLFKTHPNGDWEEFSLEQYKRKAIELSKLYLSE